ncbi:MAG: protein-L-isoaspartate(D-aspartate) O-methyltransferase [Ignavibacteria bacterium]
MNKNHAQKTAQSQYETAKKHMVEYQIKARGITDSNILSIFYKVDRHLFVPENLKSFAYEDRPLPIGEGQTISQPYIVAFMTDVLKLKRTEKVLEIGTGSGYQAAILGELCDSVFTIEINKTLGDRANSLLKKLEYKNVKVKIGDGYKGWEDYAPFDAIIVTCSPSNIPEPLKEQLKEGGRMIIPVDGSYYQELVHIKKVNNKLIKKSVLPVRFVPMIDSSGKRY